MTRFLEQIRGGGFAEPSHRDLFDGRSTVSINFRFLVGHIER
jgi:hypothetical protein